MLKSGVFVTDVADKPMPQTSQHPPVLGGGRSRHLLWLALAAGLAGLPAAAEQAVDLPDGSDRSKDADRTMQAVEVVGRISEEVFAESTFSATKTETHILDIPQSISVVTKEVIQDQGLVRLNDVTPFVAGANEFSVYDDITLRGFRSSDARRVNGLRTYNNFWSQPVIAHLERVEVIKGPGAATFGDASPGGVINMVTKKPLDRVRRELSVGLGSFDYRYAAADLTGPLNDAGTLLYRLNAAIEDSESFRERIYFDNRILAPSFTLLPREGTRLNLDAVWIDSESVLDRGQPAVHGAQELGTVPIGVSLTQPGDILDSDSLSTTLSVEQDLGPDWSLVASLQDYRYDERLVEHRIDRFLSDTEISLRYGDRDTEAEVRSGTVYLTGMFETGALMHRLVAGVDHADSDTFSRDFSARNVGVFDILNPAYIDRDVTSYPLAESSSSPYGGTLATTGYYLQDQISVGSWEVLAGLRYDRFSPETLDGGARFDNEGGNELSPRLGVVYNLDDNRSVYASWITGFEPPDVGINSPTYGGPFDPSESVLHEVGYKQLAFEGRLLFTASIYELTKTDSIVYANSPDNPDLYVQRGEERAHGFELEAAGQIGDRFQLIANYAYNDAKITEDADPAIVGQVKENAPRHSATLWGRYSLGQRWGLGAGAQHVSDRETFERTLVLPDYTVFGAGLYYKADSWQANLMVRNLTDRVHWTGGYNYGRVFPGDPRSVTLTVNYRF